MTDGSVAGPPLPAGTVAPAFSLPVGPGETLGLDDLRGHPAILAFYPADWSPVCSDQMSLYQEVKPLFDAYDARLVGISVDGVWCHGAFADTRGIEFPLLADFEPKGAMSTRYNAYRRNEGVSERALFVLDPTGTVYWSEVSPPTRNPGADGILRALDDMAGTEVPSWA
jgi:peroxiredoxin